MTSSALHSMSNSDMSNACSSTNNSVDQEREAANKFCLEAIEDDKMKLMNRVRDSEVFVGDCDNRTRLLERLGGGSFGEIYLGEMVKNKVKVAVKVEPMNCVLQFLLNEGNVYRKLESSDTNGVVGNGTGVPKVHWYGLHGTEYAMLIMELLGSTLYQQWVDCSHQFSMKTVLMIIDQMLTIIRHVHTNNFVHRDISPSNFMFGAQDSGSGHQMHLIDFGHAKKMATNLFVPAASRRRVSLARPMVGTPRFASVFTHMGQEEGYRDDMESLGYIWIYLLKGRLPWQGQRLYAGENKIDRIAYVKLNTRLETLCDGLPEEFLAYMNYVRRLKNSEMPDHYQIKELFRNLAGALGIEYDWKFDWLAKDTALSSST